MIFAFFHILHSTVGLVINHRTDFITGTKEQNDICEFKYFGLHLLC